MSMSIPRAQEILDPEHREHYTSLDPVNEACQMGQVALGYRLPTATVRDENQAILCPRCRSSHALRSASGTINNFCGNCGQALVWDIPDLAD